MGNSFLRVRGFSDFSPDKSSRLDFFLTKARDILSCWGYGELMLPALEEEGLFKRGLGESTDIIERQIFKIEGKDIALRPEGTAQVVRYFVQNKIYSQSKHSKFFYRGPMFRGERPQKGRLRQFHHIGAEVIGSYSCYTDAEIILAAIALVEAFSVKDFKLKINTLGCGHDKQKLSERISVSLKNSLGFLCDDCKRRLSLNPLRVLDCKKDSCKKLIASLEIGRSHLCKDCLEHFEGVLSLLSDSGVTYEYDQSLVRGLDYYTNTVFELTSSSLGSQDAIGAGGRYNNLIKSLGGPDIGAVGFALGLERIMIVLGDTEKGLSLSVMVITTNDGLKRSGFKIMQELRRQGVSSDMDFDGKSVKSQLRYAQKIGAKYSVILGEDEFKEDSVVLRNMEESTQDKVSIKNLVSILKKSLYDAQVIP
ncbi:MAG: histidine--tRNA ligase [Candidatus Omnitrophota bacterium]